MRGFGIDEWVIHTKCLPCSNYSRHCWSGDNSILANQQLGYSVSSSEFDDDLSCLSVPVSSITTNHECTTLQLVLRKGVEG